MGWSMTKSLMSILVAMRVADGALQWDTIVDLHADGIDARDNITARHLVDMEDGMAYNEVWAQDDFGGTTLAGG